MNFIQIIGLGAKKFGGLERYDLELAKQLQSRGDKLILVFDDFPKTNEYLIKLSETNATWFVVPFENKVAYISSLYSIFKKYHPIVVQTNFNNLLSVIIVSFLSKIFSVKGFFTTEHCFPNLNNYKTRLVYWLILKSCDHMFCVSDKSRKLIIEKLSIFEKHVKTLYLGVEDFMYDKNTSRIKYNLPLDKLIIGNVAYHNSVKGVDVLINSVEILINKYNLKNFCICQVGGGNSCDTSFLHELVNKKKLNNYFYWMGIQNNVPELLTTFDIYCQPSRSEGIPLSLMEASFAKKPIIATNVGGMSEAAIEGKNAILVPSEDPESLSAAINKLLMDEKLRILMGENARIIAYDSFLLKNQVRKLISFYDLFLNK